VQIEKLEQDIAVLRETKLAHDMELLRAVDHANHFQLASGRMMLVLVLVLITFCFFDS